MSVTVYGPGVSSTLLSLTVSPARTRRLVTDVALRAWTGLLDQGHDLRDLEERIAGEPEFEDHHTHGGHGVDDPVGDDHGGHGADDPAGHR